MLLLIFFVTLPICCLYLIKWYFEYSFKYWEKRGVPFLPPSIPFGNYTSFINKKNHFGVEIANYYKIMKSRGHKLCGYYLSSRPSLILIDPEIIKLILSKDFQYFSHRSLFYNEKKDPISAHLINVNGPIWRHMRSKMTPAFSSSRIKAVFKIFVECSDVLIKELDGNCEKAIDVKDLMSEFASNVIGSVVFGINLENLKSDEGEFKKYTKKAILPNKLKSILLLLGSTFPKLCRLIHFRFVDKDIGDYFLEMVRQTVEYREKMKIVRNDFLQTLIDMKNADGGDFSIEQVAAQCFIFLVAGFETTAATLTFALLEIAQNPEMAQKIRTEVSKVLARHQNEYSYDAVMEMKYLGQFVEETLRKYPPAYYIGRVCTDDYKLSEHNLVIEKGTFVLVPIRGLHHDPEFYPEPEKFDPERFNEENLKRRPQYTWLPFGGGPRICIGLRFAMLEATVALAKMVKEYDFKIHPDCELPFEIETTSFLLAFKKPILLSCQKL